MPQTVLSFSKVKCKSHVHRCELMVYCLADGPPVTFQHETVTCSICGLPRLIALWSTRASTIRQRTINLLPPCLTKITGQPLKAGFRNHNYICPTCDKNGVPV